MIFNIKIFIRFYKNVNNFLCAFNTAQFESEKYDFVVDTCYAIGYNCFCDQII